ncbi:MULTISPECIES: hypothetical protein [Providencia]|uniref:hypothetical protein n=1 Tax=Providencia TaxID=586 RepID=UPI00197E2BCB|nr:MULTISPECIES: hypothetical protein [Providencia]MBN4867663.1 hypothetical protein [Providencia stuartii]MBN4877167.1 hypothetical protein [Providencia stuartii]MBN4881676.1 hypothetical protein [Providencia stuartii]MBN4886178.1 hypothetical protein [Providencia stuartii]
MEGHPHAELMAKAAEIAKKDKKWWRHFEFRSIRDSHFGWQPLFSATTFDFDCEYRVRKHLSVQIGDYDFPEPVRKPLEVGQQYWVITLDYGVCPHIWTGSNQEVHCWLVRGLIHLTKEAAETHIKALLSFTQQ